MNPNDYDDADAAINQLTQPFMTDMDSEDRDDRRSPSEKHLSIKGTPQDHIKKAKGVDGDPSKTRALLISFFAMVVIGLGNKIFQVLQFTPMKNYPLFVNLLTTFVYLPMSFAYIIPMMRYGSLITKEATEVPKYKFAVMGTLDSIAGIMQSLAVNFIENGSLVILLSQAAIPVSMVISKKLLSKSYSKSQYVGAMVVAVGVIVVLIPSFVDPKKQDDGCGGSSLLHSIPLWAGIMILSCVPMCLSSVYKEIALGDTDIDAVYMNGWIAIFQFFVAIPLLLPGAPASNLSIKEIPKNLYDGMRCFLGKNSIVNETALAAPAMHNTTTSLNFEPMPLVINALAAAASNHTGAGQCVSKPQYDDCADAPYFVGIYLFFNLGYNVLILLILKFGSANILWLAMTVMVPLANFAFAFDFIPSTNRSSIHATDLVGLFLIVGGLMVYRFYGTIQKKYRAYMKERDSLGLAATPGSPFLTSKSAESDGVGTPGYGGVHTIKTRKDERQRQREQEKKALLSSRARTPDAKRYGGINSYDEDEL